MQNAFVTVANIDAIIAITHDKVSSFIAQLDFLHCSISKRTK